MKILVTGANGFIGRYLCAQLLESGHDVTAVVRQLGSAPIGADEVVVNNIGPDTQWDDVVGSHNAIVHLAARVHVMAEKSSDPLADFRRVNTAGTAALAGEAARKSVTRFVFVSSVKVNGEETHGLPFTASSPALPLDPYGISKKEAEDALTKVALESPLAVTVVRTPIVFGPGVGGNFVRILALVARRVPLPLASVSNRRSMVSIWNLASLLEACAIDMRDESYTVMAGELSSPSTPELLRSIGRAMNRPVRLFPFPVRLLRLAGAITGQSTSVQRLVTSLEVRGGSTSAEWTWTPSTSFQDGIERTVRWYESQYGLRDEKGQAE